MTCSTTLPPVSSHNPTSLHPPPTHLVQHSLSPMRSCQIYRDPKISPSSKAVPRHLSFNMADKKTQQGQHQVVCLGGGGAKCLATAAPALECCASPEKVTERGGGGGGVLRHIFSSDFKKKYHGGGGNPCPPPPPTWRCAWDTRSPANEGVCPRHDKIIFSQLLRDKVHVLVCQDNFFHMIKDAG